ncbi:MAG: hypothetical protein GY796_26015 [Chloroflexi bacterium]|nr:hypothetical protein [Chloroflexota bacterium]
MSQDPPQPLQPQPILISEQQTSIITKEIPPGSIFEIPPEGSLGLLALGAAGIEAWRQARAAFTVENKTEDPSN